MSKDGRSSAASRPRGVDTGRVDPRWLPLVDDYAALLQAELGRVCPAVYGLRVDDIEQEARSKVWQSLREKRVDNPAASVARVAARAAIDAVRRARARRKERLAPQASDATATDPEARRSVVVLEDVRRALAVMAARRRRAVALDLQGFAPEEIARILDVAVPRARRMLEYGRGRIQERIDARSWTSVWHTDELASLFRTATASGGGCPPAETLVRAMTGDLSGAPASAVADHLAACAECCQDTQALRPVLPWSERATAIAAAAPVRPEAPPLAARLRRFAFRSWW
jgi:RNA polymerase sigma factor (sigma-70 family)